MKVRKTMMIWMKIWNWLFNCRGRKIREWLIPILGVKLIRLKIKVSIDLPKREEWISNLEVWACKHPTLQKMKQWWWTQRVSTISFKKQKNNKLHKWVKWKRRTIKWCNVVLTCLKWMLIRRNKMKKERMKWLDRLWKCLRRKSS